jgi:hypothetical protein
LRSGVAKELLLGHRLDTLEPHGPIKRTHPLDVGVALGQYLPTLIHRSEPHWAVFP